METGIERLNRKLKEATVKRYRYDSHDHLEQHLQTFLGAYNYAKRLKTLKWLTSLNTSANAGQKK